MLESFGVSIRRSERIQEEGAVGFRFAEAFGVGCIPLRTVSAEASAA